MKLGGLKGGQRGGWCCRTELHPRAVTLGFLLESSVFAAKKFKTLEQVLWRGLRVAGWFRLVKKRCGSDGTASYSCLKGSYKDVSVKL